jgi:DHA2 family multidrug resistance protein-like MFS transporter
VTAAPDPNDADGLPSPRRYWAMASIWMAVVMVVLDSAIANVALPTIGRELGADVPGSIWVVNAYQLAITVTLLPVAALGEKLGFRRINIIGLMIFTVASAACALAGSLQTLVIARLVQGFGGAFVMATNAALLRHIIPQRMLGRMIGYNAVIISLAAAAGPTVASLILAAGSWRWLFAINLPIGVFALVLALRNLPRTEGHDRPFDLISTVLNALAFGFLILGAENLARQGLAAGLWKLAAGTAAAILLVGREWRRPNPLVPFDLLRIPLFGLSIATSILAFTSQIAVFVSLPFYFQLVLGRGVVETGLLMTPWPLAVAVAAPFAGHLSDRYPAGLLGGIGLALLALGLATLALLHPGMSSWDIAWRMALCGLGFGIFQSPNNRTMIAAAPRARSGAAGGMLSTARLLGQTTGAVAVAMGFHLLGVEGTNLILWGAAGVACLAWVVGVWRLRTPADHKMAMTP